MLITSLNLQIAGRFDLQIAQAVNETAPDWVVFVGNNRSIIPLYCAHLLDQAGKSAALIHIVKSQTGMPPKENIYYVEGDPLHGSSAVLTQIKRIILPWHQVMVVLEDPSHPRHQLPLIQRYAPLVTQGSYLVLEEELLAFAETQIIFEPDWVRRDAGMYLQTKTSQWFDEFHIRNEVNVSAKAAYENGDGTLFDLSLHLLKKSRGCS